MFPLGALLVVLAGCGSPTAQVSGRALYKDGSPIKGAVRSIVFQPTDDTTAVVRKAASGSIADDGSFTMVTRKAGDGVHKGKYAVTFMIMKTPRGGELLIPEKYTSGDSTPFTVEITRDRNDLLFELEKL